MEPCKSFGPPVLLEFSFFGFFIGPYGAMQKFRIPCTEGVQEIFFRKLFF